MLKKLTKFTLAGIAGLFLLPTFVNAAFVDGKKVVGDTTYTIVHKSYEYESSEDYYYIYGLITPRKFVTLFADPFDREDNTYLLFENGNYREAEATSSEVFESRKIMWNGADEELELKEFVDENENEKLGIFSSTCRVIPEAPNRCFVENSDLVAVDGKEYYTSSSAEPIAEFDPDNAHQYFVEVECESSRDILIKTLTEEERTTFGSNLGAQIAGKFNVEPHVWVVKVKNEYFLNVGVRYTDENISSPSSEDYIYDGAVYDLAGNKIDELDGALEVQYLEKSNLYFGFIGEKIIIFDGDFNVIYDMPRGDDDYIYGFDYDENTAIFDFENGHCILLTRYVVEEGENQKFDGKDLTVKFNGELDLLEEVTVNDRVLAPKNYTKTEGSTIITLSKEYLNTLNKGTYNLKATFSDGGEAATTFVVNNRFPNPETNDGIMISILLGSISLIALFGTGLYLNKKRHN